MLPASATASIVTEAGGSRTMTPQTTHEPANTAGQRRGPPNITPATPTPTASHGAAIDMDKSDEFAPRSTNSTIPAALVT